MMRNRRYTVAALCGVAMAGVATAGAAYGAKPVSVAISGIMDVALHMPVVGQRGKAFSVAEMNVKTDTTIRIANDDDVVHTLRVTSPDGDRRDAGVQRPGDATDITLDKLGDYMVRCNIHPTMKLIVHVK